MTTATARAIETYYGGMRFRSRLEARWAVFFDQLDIPFVYEPQGYVLSNGRPYLPDFYLPECRTWVEVKGSAAALDLDQLRRAALELPRPAGERLHGPCAWYETGPSLIIVGNMPHFGGGIRPDPAWSTPTGEAYRFGGYYWKHRPLRVATREPVVPSTRWIVNHDVAADEQVLFAYRVAAQARFEHGETPHPPQPLARDGHRITTVMQCCEAVWFTATNPCGSCAVHRCAA